MNDKPMSAYGRAPIKMEGGITDPDEFSFVCGCEKCQKKALEWKKAYVKHQKELRGEA